MSDIGYFLGVEVPFYFFFIASRIIVASALSGCLRFMRFLLISCNIFIASSASIRTAPPASSLLVINSSASRIPFRVGASSFKKLPGRSPFTS